MRTLLAAIAYTILVFAFGWWSAWHPDLFFARATRFGTFLNRQIDRTQVCPTDQVCTPKYPTPSPTP
jgi:hypothetical protein